jgi:hypothetical protein
MRISKDRCLHCDRAITRDPSLADDWGVVDGKTAPFEYWFCQEECMGAIIDKRAEPQWRRGATYYLYPPLASMLDTQYQDDSEFDQQQKVRDVAIAKKYMAEWKERFRKERKYVQDDILSDINNEVWHQRTTASRKAYEETVARADKLVAKMKEDELQERERIEALKGR